MSEKDSKSGEGKGADKKIIKADDSTISSKDMSEINNEDAISTTFGDPEGGKETKYSNIDDMVKTEGIAQQGKDIIEKNMNRKIDDRLDWSQGGPLEGDFELNSSGYVEPIETGGKALDDVLAELDALDDLDSVGVEQNVDDDFFKKMDDLQKQFAGEKTDDSLEDRINSYGQEASERSSGDDSFLAKMDAFQKTLGGNEASDSLSAESDRSSSDDSFLAKMDAFQKKLDGNGAGDSLSAESERSSSDDSLSASSGRISGDDGLLAEVNAIKKKMGESLNKDNSDAKSVDSQSRSGGDTPGGNNSLGR